MSYPGPPRLTESPMPPDGPAVTMMHVMAHFEIVAALIAFFGLLSAWFAVPSSAPLPAHRPAGAGADVTAHDAVPSAA